VTGNRIGGVIVSVLACKYFCKYPRMQQYVIFNVLKEYCISKEEEEEEEELLNA
jgi:hypothetical protein